jgi:hypothetical protein
LWNLKIQSNHEPLVGGLNRQAMPGERVKIFKSVIGLSLKRDTIQSGLFLPKPLF